MRRKRAVLLVVGIVVLVAFAVGGTVSVMALTHGGFLGNSGYGMMDGRSQSYHGSMMGGNQQSPVRQGTTVAARNQLTIEIATNRPGMQKDWPAFSPSNLVVPANSVVTVTIRDDDLGDTPMAQGSPFTTVQGTTGTAAMADGRAFTRLSPDKIAHTFTIPQLGVNVPLPGDATNGQTYNTVTFSFRTGAPGTYIFRCLDPCGTGPMGMMGPMMTQGYMLGTLTVQ